jgi:hypothetical protein
MFAEVTAAPKSVVASFDTFCQKEYVARSMPPTVPEVGVSATSNCRPPICLPPSLVPSEYMSEAMLFSIVRSALPMRDSRRSIIRSGPEFWSCSRPEIVTATATCFQLKDAGEDVRGGDVQHVVARVALVRAVFRVFQLLEITSPPETGFTFPRLFRRARMALFFETLSASFFDRDWIVVVTISVRLGEAMEAPMRSEVQTRSAPGTAAQWTRAR